MAKYLTNEIKDLYSPYERGLKRLNGAIRNNKSFYKDFLNFEHQLNTLIKNARMYPLDDAVSNKINRAASSLNTFCIDITVEKWSFNDICNEENICITIRESPSSREIIAPPIRS